MTAGDFTLASGDVASLTSASAITKSGATAWVTETGAPVTVTGADISKVSATPGTYPVVYTTGAGTSVTGYVTVTDENTTVDTKTGEAIYATDATVDLSQVSDLSDADLEALVLDVTGAHADAHGRYRGWDHVGRHHRQDVLVRQLDRQDG